MLMTPTFIFQRGWMKPTSFQKKGHYTEEFLVQFVHKTAMVIATLSEITLAGRTIEIFTSKTSANIPE